MRPRRYCARKIPVTDQPPPASADSPDPQPNATDQTPAARAALQWLAEYGDDLYAYAVGRVESAQVAEELVQDTFLAAVKNHAQFQQRSQPRTWLLAILRHKLINHYRQRSQRKTQSLDDVERVDYFGKKGEWRDPPSRWAAPDASLEDHELWEVFRKCLALLPGPLAEIFVLRVIDEVKSESICKTLQISASNFAVRMHRARLALRGCVGKNWFGET